MLHPQLQSQLDQSLQQQHYLADQLAELSGLEGAAPSLEEEAGHQDDLGVADLKRQMQVCVQQLGTAQYALCCTPVPECLLHLYLHPGPCADVGRA